MPKRRVAIALLALIALAVVAVTATGIVLTRSGARSSADQRVAQPRGVYAYEKVQFGQTWTQTRTEFDVMNGTKRIGRASLGMLGTDPAFTTDGRYVFALGGEQVMAVSVASGAVTRVPCEGCWDRSLKCQCQTVVPYGGSTVAWLDSDDRLVRADLAAAAPAPRRTTITVPTWHNEWDNAKPQLLAGAAGTVVAGYNGTLSDKAGPVYLVTPDGRRAVTPRRTDPIDTATFSLDGTRLALGGEDPSPGCTTVTVVDVRSGKGETGRVMTPPGAKCHSRDAYIVTTWWDPGGTLNAYVQPGKGGVVNDSQRRLTGDRWVAANDGRPSQAHPLGTGATAILSRAGVRNQDFLYVQAGGRRVKIDGNVRLVTVRPGARP